MTQEELLQIIVDKNDLIIQQIHFQNTLFLFCFWFILTLYFITKPIKWKK